MRRLHTADAVTLTATKCIDRDRTDAWIDATNVVVGAVGGGLFRVDPPAPIGRPGAGHSHLAVTPGAKAAPRAAEFGSVQADVRTDHWVRHGATHVVDADADVVALITAEVLCTDPGDEREWDDWYDAVHLPDMMTCGAFVGGTRWRRADRRPGTANHLTVYEIATATLDEAIEASASIMPGLIAAGRKHPAHTGGLTLGLVRV